MRDKSSQAVVIIHVPDDDFCPIRMEKDKHLEIFRN